MLKLKFYYVLHRHNKIVFSYVYHFYIGEKNLKSQHSFYFRQTES